MIPKYVDLILNLPEKKESLNFAEKGMNNKLKYLIYENCFEMSFIQDFIHV